MASGFGNGRNRRSVGGGGIVAFVAAVAAVRLVTVSLWGAGNVCRRETVAT